MTYSDFDLTQINPLEFEQQVRDCLAHLYDYTFLREHPLVQMVVPESSGANQVQVFRQTMTETIERLRPEIGTAFHSRQARIYNLLVLRYVDQQQPQDVMSQLGLSERQFYRDHPKAIQTLSAILWERLTGTSVPDPEESASETSTISVESEVQRVHSQGDPKSVDLKALLEGAVAATHSLAAHHDVAIALEHCESVAISGHSSGVLRQAILLITSQLIVHFADGGKLTILCAVQPHACQIRFDLDGELAEGVGLEAGFAQQRSLHTLIETLDGSLSVEAESARTARVRLDIPLKERTVLLVDDNPGMIDLFQRYLAGQTYRVLAAREGDEAVQIARQTHPDVVVLDVMLPGKDGWEVLQNLKTHPATRDIPVLICSVLDAFDLALSLGANACLKKPPNQAEFLAALARWPE